MGSILDELCSNSLSTYQLEIFINYKFQNLYDFFSNQKKKEIIAYKSDIETYISKNFKTIKQLDFNNEYNLKFVVALIEACDKLEIYMEFQNLFKLLKKNNYSFDKKLEAQSLYIVNMRKLNNYENNYKLFIDALNIAYTDEEELTQTLTILYINFYLKILKDFGEYNKEKVIKLKLDCIAYYNIENYEFLDMNLVDKVLSIDISISQDTYSDIQNIVSDYLTHTEKQFFNTDTLLIENSNYAKKLYSLNNPTFDDIRKISIEYIYNKNNQALFNKLKRGRYIIDDEELLYQYMFSYGTMHKAKLYESFAIIVEKLNNASINIIDWGCGQALATSLFVEYIKEKNIKIDIQNILLIEPSKLALSRGILHLDILKEKNYNINVVNKDLDSLEQNDISINNNNSVLHLFSNILDVEFFKLNTNFLKKISNNIQSDNYFVCVSPNINLKRNSRLDIFYKYFDDNFDTDLISTRDTDIGKYKRYEKIFKVKYIKYEEIIQERDYIKDYHIDIYTKLSMYSSIIEPILNPDRLKQNIESDPDYVIFKIRKVTEIITSKIFINNDGKDESKVSQNDKIKYLSFEKKLLSRKAQSLLHTIRTLGNIATHEHIDNPINMLKEDAYFLVTALVLLIEDFQFNNIIPSSQTKEPASECA